MPTKRLDYSSRNDIKSRFYDVIDRALYAQPAPVEYNENDELYDFILECAPKELLQAVEVVRSHQHYLIRYASNISFSVEYKEGFYRVHVSLFRKRVLDYDKYVLPIDHPLYNAWLTWCQQKFETKERIKKAFKYLTHAIDCCSSAGQVKRIFPECIQYLDERTRATLEDAQRKSRLPIRFSYDQEKIDLVTNAMALGALSPEIDYQMKRHACRVQKHSWK